jgi:hypothetical protein
MLGVVGMPRVKARPLFGRVIARAGLTRGQVATAAGISTRTIDALANPGAAGRQGYAREVTAWKSARGFAELTKQTDDAAFAALFETYEDDMDDPA